MDFEQVLTGEAFLFLAETVDPDGLEAEVGRSADVPGVGREEEDFTGFGFELFDSKLVDPWIGFEDPDFLHREDRIDQLFKTRVVYPGSKHFGGSIGEDRGSKTSIIEPFQGFWNLRVTVQLVVGLEQLGLQFRIDDLMGGECIFQRVAGDLSEIDMLTHQASQPGVFELFGSPENGDGIGFFPKDLTVSSDG